MADYLNIHLEIAILGGQLYNEDGSKQPSTGKFYTPWYAFLLLFGGQKLGILDKSPSIIQPVDWVKGALLMIRKDDFDQLKGFDEKMFMYMEDMEFCYRAHLAGKSTYFYPEVHIIHKEHGSANKTFAIVNIYTNLLYFYKKHRSPLEYQTIKILSQMKARMLICIGKVTHTPYLTETYTRALDAIG
jgi:GT2 family glycosyltransferase